MAVYTLDAGNLTQWAFNSDACRSKVGVVNAAGDTVYTELATGMWKVTIENTEGDYWESNNVEVVYYGEAIMSDWSIEDDYDTTPMNVVLGKTTGTAILNVTFNKNYAGKLYLIDSKIEKGYGGHINNVINLGALAAGPGSIEDGLQEVKTKSQLTNKNATAELAGGGDRGIYWEDATGAVHCKIVVALTAGQTVTRGSSYYLVWDQDDNDDDDLVAATSKREDLNASDDFEVPYVQAPDSIKVSSFAKGSDTVKVDALDEDGEKLAWYTNANGTLTALGLDSAKIFEVDTNEKSSTDSSKDAATRTVKDGTYTFTDPDGDINTAYVYVKLTTKAGVFAKDSITLESDLSETARDALTSMSLEEDSTTPTSAVVKFKGLSTKAPGKVYIMQGNNSVLATSEVVTGAANDGEAAFARIAAHGLTDAIAEADVEGGAASVTIPNVFEADDMVAGAGTYGSDMGNNAFVAVFVPDDEELWKRANSIAENGNGNDVGFTLTPSITTIDKSGLTAELTTVSATVPEITIKGIQAMDQFGNKWVGTQQLTNAASVSKNNSTVTNTEDATVKNIAGTAATTTVTATGEIQFIVVNKDAAAWDKGDGVTIKVPGLKNLQVTLTAKDLLTFAATYISVGTDAGDTTTRVGVNATLNAVGGAAGDLKLSSAFSIS